MKYEAQIIALGIYEEYERKLKADAETVASSSWTTCGRDIDESVLEELQVILRHAADEVHAVLLKKLSELPDDVDTDLLAAYGLR